MRNTVTAASARRLRRPAGSRFTGAHAVPELLRRISDSANDDFAAHPAESENADVHDYQKLAAVLDGALQAHYVHASAVHRQGFLLALSELLLINVEGCGAGVEFEPLATQKGWTPTGREATDH